MIIKPSPPGQGGPALARYLTEGKNEHAEVLELRNMDAPSLQAALFDMDMLARGQRTRTNARTRKGPRKGAIAKKKVE